MNLIALDPDHGAAQGEIIGIQDQDRGTCQSSRSVHRNDSIIAGRCVLGDIAQNFAGTFRCKCQGVDGSSTQGPSIFGRKSREPIDLRERQIGRQCQGNRFK